MDYDRLSSISRHLPLLLELRGKDGLRQSEIRDRLDQSKSTTHRNVKALTELDLVTKNESGYNLTELGRTVTREVEDCVSRLDAAYRYSEFLDTIQHSDLDIDDLTDAEVTQATETNPMAPLVRLAEITTTSTRVRVLTNSIAPRSFDVGREGVRSGDKDIQMVLDSRTIDTVQETRWYGEELVEDLETGNLEIHIHEEPAPYQIGVFDAEKLCIGAEDPEGRPKAMLTTTDTDAVSWAERTFKQYKQESEQLLPSDI